MDVTPQHPLASGGVPEADDLLSTLEVIENQPLAERAEAYEALHDALARRLESAPTDARP